MAAYLPQEAASAAASAEAAAAQAAAAQAAQAQAKAVADAKYAAWFKKAWPQQSSSSSGSAAASASASSAAASASAAIPPWTRDRARSANPPWREPASSSGSQGSTWQQPSQPWRSTEWAECTQSGQRLANPNRDFRISLVPWAPTDAGPDVATGPLFRQAASIK